MNEEIKEILDNLKTHNDYYKNQEHNYAFPDYYSLNYEDLDILLNYITNLQEENQKLNKVIEDIGEKTMLILNDILLIKNGLGKDVVRLNKLTELKKEVE